MKTTQLVSLAAYHELRRRVREALALGRKRAEAAVEQEKVRTSWEIGKLIEEHILLNKERADYGQKVLKRLSADLGVSHTELKYMLEFARAYPIGPPAGQLSWSDHRELLAVNEPEKRKAIAHESERKRWSSKTIRREIRRLKSKKQISVSEGPAEEPLIPLKGKLDTYRVVIAKVGPWKGEPVLDLGFSNYFTHPSLKLERFKEGDVVSVEKKGDRLLLGNLSPFSSATPADLFTYRAYPFKITDGDTLWVVVDLGFGVLTQQHLRLRGIDTPEIESAEGRKAKAFLEEKLRKGPLVIRTAKSDKYDRYLADVFYSTPSGEKFLNNELLKAGLAVRDNG